MKRVIMVSDLLTNPIQCFFPVRQNYLYSPIFGKGHATEKVAKFNLTSEDFPQMAGVFSAEERL